MLQAMDGVRGHFMRNTKGFIGTESDLWDEGYTGQYNPATPRDLTGVFYAAFLPEVRKKGWNTGLYILLVITYVTMTCPEACRAAKELWKNAPRRRLTTDARRGAGRRPEAARLSLHSAQTLVGRLNSVPRLAQRGKSMPELAAERGITQPRRCARGSDPTPTMDPMRRRTARRRKMKRDSYVN